MQFQMLKLLRWLVWAFYSIFVRRGHIGGGALENGFWLAQVIDYLDAYCKVGVFSKSSCNFSALFAEIFCDCEMLIVYFAQLTDGAIVFADCAITLWLPDSARVFIFSSVIGVVILVDAASHLTSHLAAASPRGTSDLTRDLWQCLSSTSVWSQAEDKLRFFYSILEAEVREPSAKNGFLRIIIHYN